MRSVSTRFAPFTRDRLYPVKDSALPLVCLAVLLLPSLPARAGSYVLTSQTGGQATATPGPPAGPPPQRYHADAQDSNNNRGYGANIGNGSSQGASADCEGAISTVFTWQPDDGQTLQTDPPPQQVVVCETCTAECDGQEYSNPTPAAPAPACDDGLGDTPTTSSGPIHGAQDPTVIIGAQASATSHGTRYQIMSGGPTVTIPPCSASASVSVSDGPAHASVIYNVSVSPLDLVLTGGIGSNGAKRYLIGQQCTATLESGGLIPSNYNWTASGGDPFLFWLADQDEAQLTPLGLDTFDSLSFYFKKPDTGTVSCTVDLAVPAGAKPAGGFPGTVVTQQCQVEPPSASFSAYIGDVEFSYPDVSLAGVPDPGGYGQPVGITWPSFAQTPTDYSIDGLGGWNYVQIDTSDERRVNRGIAQAFTLNGIPCLDNEWPYDAASYPTDAGGVGAFAADGNVDTRADAPLSSVFDGLSYFNQEDGFQTWLMYCPPGSNSSYVPIRKIKWYWHASLSLISNAWSLTSSPTDCGWSFDGGLYPEFPEWNERLNNDYLGTPDAFTPPVP